MALTKDHEDFARDVVAVAKKHGMDHLRMTFEPGFDLQKRDGFKSWGAVEMSWTEPREGADKFHLKAEQHANFPTEQ